MSIPSNNQRVRRSGERLWRIEDFDGSPSAVNNELRRMVARGELMRVRRGVYWHGRRSRFGMIGASQGAAVQKLLGPHEAIGATGWQASKLLGLSTQVSPIEALAVTHRGVQGLENVRMSSSWTEKLGDAPVGQTARLARMWAWRRHLKPSSPRLGSRRSGVGRPLSACGACLVAIRAGPTQMS